MLVLIEQTNHCDLQCVSCPNRLNQRPRGIMSAANFRRIVDQINHLKDERVALHGFGEPLLSSYLWENLKYLDSRGFTKVDLTSNGMSWIDSDFKKITEFKCISWVRISLNSSSKEVMEKINGGADFEKVINTIRKLITIKPRFKLHVQLMQCDLTSGESQKDFEKLIGSEDFIFTTKPMHDFYGQVKDGLSDKRSVDCEQVFGALPMMHWDGDLVGCCGDDTKSQVYGNALRDGIFSEKTLIKRKLLSEALKIRNYSELPLCQICVQRSN